MTHQLIKTALMAAGIAALPALGSASVAQRSVSLTQDPVVMRLSKDEFRIAFGINGERCAANGCYGEIRYRVDWKTEDGTARSEIKRVSYSVSPTANRAMTVDRQYFDTAEGAHRTDIVKVRVDAITCLDGSAGAVRTAMAVVGHNK